MSDPCKNLLDKKYSEVLEENKASLRECIHNRVFDGQSGLEIDFSDHNVAVRFLDTFFNGKTFYEGSRSYASPNMSKIRRFYSSMREIQHELEYKFVVGDIAEPELSMEHLTMKITLMISDRFLAKIGLSREEMSVKDFLEYIRKLWVEIKRKLSIRRYII